MPPRPARALALSSDARLVAAVDAAGNVARWRMSTRGPVALPELGSRGAADAAPAPSEPSVDPVAFSADGARIAAGSTDGSVRVWEGDTLVVVVPGYARVRSLAVQDGALVIDSFTHEWRAPVHALGELVDAGPPTVTSDRTRVEVGGTALAIDDGHVLARDASGQELYRLYLLTDGSTYARKGAAFQLGGSARRSVRVQTPAGLKPFELAEDRWQADLLGGASALPYRSVAELQRAYPDLALRTRRCGHAMCSRVALAGIQLAPCCSESGGCGIEAPAALTPDIGCVPLQAPGQLDPNLPGAGAACCGLAVPVPGLSPPGRQLRSPGERARRRSRLHRRREPRAGTRTRCSADGAGSHDFVRGSARAVRRAAHAAPAAADPSAADALNLRATTFEVFLLASFALGAQLFSRSRTCLST